MTEFVPPPGFDENEDEAINVLEGWLDRADELAEWAERLLADGAELQEETRRSALLIRRAARKQLEVIPRILEAAYAGDTWGAIVNAMRAGMMSGLIDADPDTYHALRKLREAEPDAAIWREKRERHAEGGRSTRRLPPDEVLEREVSELHQRRPNLKWKRVCELVAQQYGVKDWRAVARKLQGGPADWRAKSP